jgi:multiple sugar transport system ATP-binding protein
LLDRKPKQLSGGQRQRVAVGRAIVRNPKVFLFDEPLSNLDAKLRVQMRAELKRLHQNLQATIIYVTHDQVEAMTMADKIVIMKDGIIQQIGDPYSSTSSRETSSLLDSSHSRNELHQREACI